MATKPSPTNIAADHLDAYAKSLRYVQDAIFPGAASKALAMADKAAAVAALRLVCVGHGAHTHAAWSSAQLQIEILTSTTRTPPTPDEIDGWVAKWRAFGAPS